MAMAVVRKLPGIIIGHKKGRATQDAAWFILLVKNF
jgi:hypothetical protein